MNLSIIIIMVKVKNPDNMIETFPHSLQWRKVTLYHRMTIVSCILGKSGVFFILYWKGFCLASYTIPFILFCVHNGATGSEWLCQCFRLLIELLASVRMPSECMSILLSACMVSKSKGSPISHYVEVLLELGKFSASLMPQWWINGRLKVETVVIQTTVLMAIQLLKSCANSNWLKDLGFV